MVLSGPRVRPERLKSGTLLFRGSLVHQLIGPCVNFSLFRVKFTFSCQRKRTKVKYPFLFSCHCFAKSSLFKTPVLGKGRVNPCSTFIYTVVVFQSPVLNVCRTSLVSRGREEVVRTPGVLNEGFTCRRWILSHVPQFIRGDPS